MLFGSDVAEQLLSIDVGQLAAAGMSREAAPACTEKAASDTESAESVAGELGP